MVCSQDSGRVAENTRLSWTAYPHLMAQTPSLSSHRTQQPKDSDSELHTEDSWYKYMIKMQVTHSYYALSGADFKSIHIACCVHVYRSIEMYSGHTRKIETELKH